MEAEFWLERWADGRTGFHEGGFNRHLQRWWPELGLASAARVLVPLCGKAHDLLWLHERGHRVLGVDLAGKALDDFRAEHGVQDGLELLHADFFEVDSGRMSVLLGGQVDAWYDRAALVALPPPTRIEYAAHLRANLPSGARGLLVTFAYPQEQKEGPPFSVEDDEVHALFADGFSLQMLHEESILDRESRHREQGLTRLEERVYRIERSS